MNITARSRAANVLLAISTLAALLLISCDASTSRSKRDLERAAATAKSSGRAAATAEMLAEFKAERITLSDAIDVAWAKLDAGEDVTVFAGAVLDLAIAVEDDLPHAGEFELLWIRIGRLAFKSADMAMSKGRAPEAATLVLGGPTRWQNEPYWRRYPDHDALAAVVLAATGRKDEAIKRLRSRADLEPPADEVLRQLTR